MPWLSCEVYDFASVNVKSLTDTMATIAAGDLRIDKKVTRVQLLRAPHALLGLGPFTSASPSSAEREPRVLIPVRLHVTVCAFLKAVGARHHPREHECSLLSASRHFILQLCKQHH